jgi:DNA-binding transcriptional regulator YiaG
MYNGKVPESPPGEITMPNVATALKAEISRLARREIKAETGSTKQAVAQYRRDIAKLKRTVQAQQKEIVFLKTQERKRLGQPQTKDEGELEGVRHSARSVRAQRKRLGLSATDFGKLVGVSGLTVYNWEHDRVRPGKDNLAALVAVRKLGKREAMAKLELL